MDSRWSWGCCCYDNNQRYRHYFSGFFFLFSSLSFFPLKPTALNIPSQPSKEKRKENHCLSSFRFHSPIPIYYHRLRRIQVCLGNRRPTLSTTHKRNWTVLTFGLLDWRRRQDVLLLLLFHFWNPISNRKINQINRNGRYNNHYYYYPAPRGPFNEHASCTEWRQDWWFEGLFCWEVCSFLFIYFSFLVYFLGR